MTGRAGAVVVSLERQGGFISGRNGIGKSTQLHTLSASGRVIVPSHNLVLAPLLGDALSPWRVSRVNAGVDLQGPAP
jgi:predicted ATPase